MRLRICRHIRDTRRRGFTLIEALAASAILLAVVVSVTSAITAGQEHALEANQRIAATLAAEELLGRLIIIDYASLPTWDGHNEPVGSMTDGTGEPMPPCFAMVGRSVSVVTTIQSIPSLGVNVNGRQVRVQAFDADGRTLADISRFLPEPRS